MEIREEPKRLLERIEAIEAENRASKETAESKRVDKPPVKKASEAKTEKPARKPRKPVEVKPVEETEKKEPVLPEKKPSEGTPVKEPVKAAKTRTRKPRAVKAAEPKPEKASFVLYNCDEAKTQEGTRIPL